MIFNHLTRNSNTPIFIQTFTLILSLLIILYSYPCNLTLAPVKTSPKDFGITVPWTPVSKSPKNVSSIPGHFTYAGSLGPGSLAGSGAKKPCSFGQFFFNLINLPSHHPRGFLVFVIFVFIPSNWGK